MSTVGKWTLSGTSSRNAALPVNPNTRYQFVRGFGGMDIPWLFGGWQNITISREEYEMMYNPNGPLGFNIMRIMINPIKGKVAGANDNTPEDNKFIHAEDPVEFLDFITSPAGGRPDYIEGVKIVNKHGGYVLASPWSPPKAWKANNKISGGTLLPARYGDYANYLKKFATEMSDRGAPLYAISIQNEPNYGTEKEDYEGCGWSETAMRDFFVQVGDFTADVPGYGGGAATERVLIMNGESANTPLIHNAAMQNETSRAIIDLLARHNYGSLTVTPYNPGADFGKEMWMTEMNLNSRSAAAYPNDSTWNYMWIFLNDVDMSIRGRGDNAYVWWALKRFYSLLGDGQYGTTDKAILPRGYALAHYAKFAKEKYRIGVTVTSGNAGMINHAGINRDSLTPRVTAFISESGSELSVVMYTPTSDTGGGGYDLGVVKIEMPSGFVAASATAMRSNANVKGQTEAVRYFDREGKYAMVTLPRSEILSVKFVKK
jgi:O-glycosyl hydrolase